VKNAQVKLGYSRTTPSNSKVICAYLLRFKPIFNLPPLKNVKKPFVSVKGALVRLGNALARVKIWGRCTPWGPKYGPPNNAFWVGQN